MWVHKYFLFSLFLSRNYDDLYELFIILQNGKQLHISRLSLDCDHEYRVRLCPPWIMHKFCHNYCTNSRWILFLNSHCVTVSWTHSPRIFQAAWGGGVLLSKNTRHKMAGVERSQSITWNPHKLMGVLLQCSTVHFQEDVRLNRILYHWHFGGKNMAYSKWYFSNV